MLGLLLTCTVILRVESTMNEQTANQTIFDLDKRIIKLMLRPERGKGPEAYQLLNELFTELRNILQVLKKKVDDGWYVSLGRKLVSEKGLKVFKAPISEELLKVTYKWSQDFLDKFVNIISDCKKVYERIELL